MNIVIATCRKRPELTSSDDLLRLKLGARGMKVSAAHWDPISSGEFELIDPDLFPELAPAGATILAEALVASAGQKRTQNPL